MSAQVRESRQRRGEQLWSKQGHRRNQKTRTFPPRPLRFRHTHAVDRHLRRRVGIRAGRRAADFEGRNDGFRDAAAEMEVARDNAKELFLLTLPSLHCHLQKAWLPKGSERGRLKGPPLRVYSLAGLVQKVGWAKNIFRRSKMSKWGHEFPLPKARPLDCVQSTLPSIYPGISSVSLERSQTRARLLV